MGGGVAPFTEGGGTGGARWTRPSPAAGHTESPNVWLPRADALKGPVVLPAAVLLLPRGRLDCYRLLDSLSSRMERPALS